MLHKNNQREHRHVKPTPTREAFYPINFDISAETMEARGAFAGALIEEGAGAIMQGLVPHDFKKIKDLKLVIIPKATATDMPLYVWSNYAYPGELHNQQEKGFRPGSSYIVTFDTVLNILTEVDISDIVTLPNAQLSPKNYLGIRIDGLAGTNLIALGFKLRYYSSKHN